MTEIEDNKELLQLNDMEARIVGALMEKQLTTPDAYPLTLNSLVLACNQKTSREPITNLTNAQVQQTVNDLRERKIIDVEYGSRADRYDQKLSKHLFLDKQQQALINIMLLRGPQTIGDLYSRTQRMTEFNSPEDIEERLQTMCDKTSPIVIRIPRQSGQREDRYMHVLSGAIDLSQLTLRAPELKTVESSQAKSITESESNDSDLRALVQKLEERVAVLEEKIEELLS
ncbi:MAG: YceH family protein [Cellvibrionaceae bacterium]